VPKKKSKGKAKRAAVEAEPIDKRSTLRTRMVRWAAISVILALMLSLLVAAISVSPSSASPLKVETPCAQIDSDGDAITNDIDSDIDGDGTINGLDDDIDGDKILNGEDGDPAATNCGKNAPPPVILPEPENLSTSTNYSWIAIAGVALLGFGYLVLRRVRASKK
jgi:LPXTG-motif cell wall-anchored protein